MKMGQIYDLLLEHAAQHREAELASGLCLSGPHKDEIELTIDGAEARGFASQGQARTAALSLKLAERDISEQDAGDMPVLLLDDVLSELDDARRDFVLNRITGGQVLITCCQNDGIAELTGGKVLGIHAGRITGGGLTL
jgi:DNA replication and repair protein RecF